MTDQKSLRRKSVFPTYVDLLGVIILSRSLSHPLFPHPLLFLVFFDLLQGSHQSFGCGALAQPLGCCRSNGRCSFLKPVGPPRSSSWASPTPPPTARPPSQPRHPKTGPGPHPHHPRANPLLPLLTHHPLTPASTEQPLQKHTVKIQT